ncbi:MAG: class I SAM-dependent methyltransferase [Actinomycetota bacterium]
MAQFHFSPDTYLDATRREVPDYDTLPLEVGEASARPNVRRVLDLGAGTGTTSLAVLSRHPSASLCLVDESADMLEIARNQVPGDRIERIDVGDLRDELPGGPFDLVVSALAIHHLDGAEKQVLFGRVRHGLRRDGRFVLGDVVVPEDPADAVTPLTPGYDKPDHVPDLLEWLTAARFTPAVTWSANDLVVIAADVEA